MSICDTIEGWNQMDYGERLSAVRDWVKEQSESWGLDRPSVVVGKSVDEEGQEHWASYDRDTDTITVDPDLLRDPDTYAPEDVMNSVAHEFRHAMQDQFDEESEDDEDFMDGDEREADSDDFAEAYSDYWEDECEDPPENESVPGDQVGDWVLPAEGGAYA